MLYNNNNQAAKENITNLLVNLFKKNAQLNCYYTREK